MFANGHIDPEVLFDVLSYPMNLHLCNPGIMAELHISKSDFQNTILEIIHVI